MKYNIELSFKKSDVFYLDENSGMMFVGSEKALDDKKKILLIFFLCEILLVFDDNLGFLGNYM